MEDTISYNVKSSIETESSKINDKSAVTRVSSEVSSLNVSTFT